MRKQISRIAQGLAFLLVGLITMTAAAGATPDRGTVRAEFDARLIATSTFTAANLPVAVTGVGFFDSLHGQTGVAPNGIESHPLLDISFSGTPVPTPTPPPGSGQCTSVTGPGIPPPASVPAGIAGFHAAWYGQSGYQSLCPGTQATATVTYSNTGSFGWVDGKLGEAAYLGTWNPIPGQDRPSVLGGDGTSGSPNTGWPRYNRVAVQPAPYVGPGQIARFQFAVRAPTTPGRYALVIRPLIEGAQWMEDYGVFWYFTVLNPDGSAPPPPPPSPTPTPTPTPAGSNCTTAPANPWGYDFCSASVIYAPPSSFCSYFSCVPSFWSGGGYVVECNDAAFSLSGGLSGACLSHGGVRRTLYAHPFLSF